MHRRRETVPIPPPGTVPAPASAPPPRRAAFNVMLSDEDYSKLDALAGVLQLSRGAVIRKAVAAAYAMTVQGVPMCASGAFCPMPQIHQRGPLPQTGTPGQGGA